MPQQTAPQRNPGYEVLDGSRAEFALDNFGLAQPFSSFLPGIAGPLGIPMWCFYVNRGQGVCAFGVENKDGAILEFEPANKAYRDAARTGFRTFLRLGHQGLFYEPFQENQANLGHQRKTRMIISPFDLRLEEENRSLGIKVTVRYFTLPNRPLAALCRELTLESLGTERVELELLDGLPQVAPFGLGDLQRKSMGRTMEAWSHAEGLEEGLPYLRQRFSSEDTVEVKPVNEGHFFCGWVEGGAQAAAVVDPGLVFGHASDLGYPQLFAPGALDTAGQAVENRTPCAFLHARLTLNPEQPRRLLSAYGRAHGVAQARACAAELRAPGAFDAWALDNERTILGVAGRGWISSGIPALDGYALQNFLDNVLRGGLAVTLEDGERHSSLHLYSRKHGDLERDYNAFSLMPSPFSQGNGAFRDICQNRRNDSWTHPRLGDASLRYFANLIQLDGNNPLVVQGLEYVWEGGEEGWSRLAELLPSGEAAALAERMTKPFTPRDLQAFLRSKSRVEPGLLKALTAAALSRSRALEKAEPDHGYWTDHGFYLNDMLESFEALYPDQMTTLMSSCDFSFYDSALMVAPRAQKLKKSTGGWRQYGGVVHDKEKAALIAARAVEPRRARTRQGQGEVFFTSLPAKLLCLAANKLASLDAAGVGLEMDSEKPDWNDAVNGLPGLFGSSTNESFELKRLVLNLRRWLKPGPPQVGLPAELAGFLRGLAAAPAEPFAFWRESGRLKEAYRAQVRWGVDGALVYLTAAELDDFLAQALARLESGLAKALRPDSLLHTYFVNTPQVEEGHGQAPVITGFTQRPLPLFLEGQVHALRLATPAAAAQLAAAVEGSQLHDPALKMFKVNAPLEGTPMEIGRLRAFTPGWLENESVFMHMEFKYLLELLKAGLHDDFYRHLKSACPAFLDPAVYGRSIFENSSFIASSANPDPHLHGRGFVARLSGTTCEFHEMLLRMALGPRPFRMEQGELVFEARPALQGSLFSKEPKVVELIVDGEVRRVELEAGSFAAVCFGRTLLVIHGQQARNTYGEGGMKAARLCLDGVTQPGPSLKGEAAGLLRDGFYGRVDLWLA